MAKGEEPCRGFLPHTFSTGIVPQPIPSGRLAKGAHQELPYPEVPLAR